MSLSKTINLLLIASVLFGCGRAEDPANPVQIIIDPEPQCLTEDQSVYEPYNFFSSLTIDGGSINFNYLNSHYSLNKSFLDSVQVFRVIREQILLTPQIQQQYIDGSDVAGAIKLTEEQISILNTSNASIKSINIQFAYTNSDGQEVTTELDQNSSAVRVALEQGQNDYTISLRAIVDEPVVGIECGDYGSASKRTVNVEQNFSFSIVRDTLDTLLTSIDTVDTLLPSDISTAAFSVTPTSIDINEDYLVLGYSEESSSSRGVFINTPGNDPISDQINGEAISSGAALIYRKNQISDEWILHGLVKAPNADPGDNFGHSVKLLGNTLFISAPREDSNSLGVISNLEEIDVLLANNSAISSGAVYEYSLGDVSISLESVIKPTYLTSNLNESYKSFGLALSVSNGYLFIGNPSANNTGIVHVYDVSSTPGFHQTIDSYTADNDEFGRSLASKNNILVIGAPSEDSDVDSSAGSVYNLSMFGADSIDQLVDNSSEDSGAAFVYKLNSESKLWELKSILKASNADAGDRFGSTVELGRCYSLSDFESDDDRLSGCYISVGVALEDSMSSGINLDMQSNSYTDSGAAYVFKSQDDYSNWFEDAYIKPSNNSIGAQFGSAIGFADDTLFSLALGDQQTNGSVGMFSGHPVWSQTDSITLSSHGSLGLALNSETLVIADPSKVTLYQ